MKHCSMEAIRLEYPGRVYQCVECGMVWEYVRKWVTGPVEFTGMKIQIQTYQQEWVCSYETEDHYLAAIL